MRNQLISFLERIFAHPKTTLAGVILMILVGLYIYHKIDLQQMGVVIGVLTSGGLIISKDPKSQQ